jgi:molecular chaperone DnaK
MLKESEQYAEEDKKRRAVIEEANRADNVCAETEKGECQDQFLTSLLH